MHTAMHAFFHSIAEKYYNEYKQVNENYNKLTNNNQQWDILSHSPEENAQYFKLFRLEQEAATITVVFSVMAIEALINEYGFVYLGPETFKENERKSIQDKIIDFYLSVTGTKFPTDKQLYQKITDLISVRNTLVHSKSVEIDFGDLLSTAFEADRKFFTTINAMIGNSKNKVTKQKTLFEVVQKCNEVYPDLKDFLQDTAPVK